MLTQLRCTLIDEAEDYPLALAEVARRQQALYDAEDRLAQFLRTPAGELLPRGECHVCGVCTGEMRCHDKTEAGLVRKMAAADIALAQAKIRLSRCYAAAQCLGEA